MSFAGLTPDEQEPVKESLSAKANKAMIEAVRKEKPQSFTVGVTADVLAKNVDLTITYDRKLSNAFGLTAYLKAWYHDAAVIPAATKGLTIGAQGKVDF